ncbi:large ribosomal subunit protein uL3 [Candidatus Vidania fulgoroideorum]
MNYFSGIKKNCINVFYKGDILMITIIFLKNNFVFKNILNKNFNIKSRCKGKGFSGTIKKHGFSSNYKSHGNSKAHRKPGSIGMCQDPGRVFKGKKMCGNLGNNFVCLKNSKLIYINKNFIYIKGPIPGSYNSIIKIYLNENFEF